MALVFVFLLAAPLAQSHRHLAQLGAFAPSPMGSPDAGEGGDPCLLPFETGVCKAYYLQYYYNAANGACDPFVWGGCGGNANRFMTLEECQTACSR